MTDGSTHLRSPLAGGSSDAFENPPVAVRGLQPDDFLSVLALDEKNTGRRREEFYKIKLQQNLAETGIKVSLAAEVEGLFVGFLLARVFYGEFGTMEPTAVLDTFEVHPDFQRRGVGFALLEQLKKNLSALQIGVLRTDVSWDDQNLLGFFHHEGFRPAPRLSLELDLSVR